MTRSLAPRLARLESGREERATRARVSALPYGSDEAAWNDALPGADLTEEAWLVIHGNDQ